MGATTIGKRIREIRNKKKMTRVMLSERSKVTYGTLSQYESDRRQPRLDQLNKIANALEVDIKVLTNLDIDLDTAMELFYFVGEDRQEYVNAEEIAKILNSADGVLQYLGYEVLYEMAPDFIQNSRRVFDYKSGKVYNTDVNELNQVIESIIAFGKFQMRNYFQRWEESSVEELEKCEFVEIQKRMQSGHLLLNKLKIQV